MCIRVQPQQHSVSYSEYHSWTITRPETHMSLDEERGIIIGAAGWVDTRAPLGPGKDQ